MRLGPIALLIGAVAIVLPVPASAGQRMVMIELCGSGKRMPLPLDDSPDRPGSAGCHAAACIASRQKSNGERP